jgi:ketosteroid isomerase-like protein
MPRLAEREQILEVTEEENNAIAAGDAARYFAILADDCMMTPSNLGPKTGTELRDWLSEFLGLYSVLSLQYMHGEIAVAGDWAWHEYACHWRVIPRAGGEATTPWFRGLHILRRESDGTWKLVRNIWNVAPPPAA